jgi:hypothetical protein
MLPAYAVNNNFVGGLKTQRNISMKKNKLFLLGLLGMVLTFGLVFMMSCDNGGTDPDPTPSYQLGDVLLHKNSNNYLGIHSVTTKGILGISLDFSYRSADTGKNKSDLYLPGGFYMDFGPDYEISTLDDVSYGVSISVNGIILDYKDLSELPLWDDSPTE